MLMPYLWQMGSAQWMMPCDHTMLPCQPVVVGVRPQHRFAYGTSSAYQQKVVPTNELVLLDKAYGASYTHKKIVLCPVYYPLYNTVIEFSSTIHAKFLMDVTAQVF